MKAHLLFEQSGTFKYKHPIANENNDKAYDLAIKQAYTNGVMDLSRYLDTGEKTEMLEIVLDEIRKTEEGVMDNECDD